jgi:hypothetical protein
MELDNSLKVDLVLGVKSITNIQEVEIEWNCGIPKNKLPI